MKLATLRTRPGPVTVAVRVTDTEAIEIHGFADVGALLLEPDWQSVAAAASGSAHPLDTINPQRWAPVIPTPGKIVCTGLNYRNHILEMGRELPGVPTFFAKYAESLIGAFDDIELPAVSDAVDWEGELAVIIGSPARNLNETESLTAIAGYAILNDVSGRDYQYRTLQWLQGKTFEHTTPLGPYLVTADEWTPGPTLHTVVDGETVQEGSTGDLVFSPATLVSYLSQILTLKPGDVIATGTPGGVGHARTPQRYLVDGTILETTIDGLGSQRNTARKRGAITMVNHARSAPTDSTTNPDLLAALQLARAGTAYFFQHLDTLPDDDFAGTSLLPGWDRAHVLSHVGHNGTGLTNLAEWAATGVEKPMYASSEFRNAQIEEGADLPPAELRQLCRDTAAVLDAHWRALSDTAWHAELRLAPERVIPASTTVWMRTREMWLHTVDLNSGASYDDFPAEFIDHLIADVLSMWRGRATDESIPNFVLVPDDRNTVRSIGPADAPDALRLHGSAANLARWVTGRGAEGVSTESGEPVPTAPKWL